MVNIPTKINRLIALSNTRNVAEEELRKEGNPTITDHKTAANIYNAMKKEGFTTNAILFVLIYLCSPANFAGVRLRKGWRSHFATLFGYRTANAISVRSKNLFFLYRTYGDFREEVERGVNLALKFI